MAFQPLPSDVAAFIADRLLSIDEIEALVALCDASARWWDARLISGELGVPLSTARSILDRLAGLNLLDIKVTDEVRYRLQPGTTELAQIVSRLVSNYRTNPKAVIGAITHVARRDVLDFADAFRLRRDDGRG